MKELYPDVNVKIFCRKNFRRLLARFGVSTEPVARARDGGVVVRGDNYSEVTR